MQAGMTRPLSPAARQVVRAIEQEHDLSQEEFQKGLGITGMSSVEVRLFPKNGSGSLRLLFVQGKPWAMSLRGAGRIYLPSTQDPTPEYAAWRDIMHALVEKYGFPL